jgi:hypothetical protein
MSSKIERGLEVLRQSTLEEAFNLAAASGLWVIENRIVYVPCLTCDLWGMIERVFPSGPGAFLGLGIVVAHARAKSTRPDLRLDPENVGLACSRCNSRMETDQVLAARFLAAVEGGALGKIIKGASENGRTL